MKTFVEIHAIQNFAPSSLNRDDTGAPKDAIFGGSRRARISSQCLKRAVRCFFKQEVQDRGLSTEILAVRTKRLHTKLVDYLVSKGRDPEESQKRVPLAMLGGAGIMVKNTDSENYSQFKSEYLLYIGEGEIPGLGEVINDVWDTENWGGLIKARAGEDKKPDQSSEGKPKKKADPKKKAQAVASKELKKGFKKVLSCPKSVEIALFGRMLTDMPKQNQNAACQVAHAISTHKITQEFDFYTALDDLKPDEKSGSDMVGTVEFNSACYYRYAVVDWEQLKTNLNEDVDLAEIGLREFLKAFTLSVPTGKQNSFAAHNPPELVCISVRRETSPRNFANAFEVPIQIKSGESLSGKSAEALIAKARSLDKAFGSNGVSFVLDLTGLPNQAYGERKENLTSLLEDVIRDVKG